MKNKQMHRTNSFIAKTLLALGLLLAVANMYGQGQQNQQKQQVQQKQQGQQSPEAKDTSCCKHEFSVWGAGGFSKLSYSPTFGDRSSKLGGAFGVGYTYYFNCHFGILAGAELAFYGAKLEFNGLSDSYRTLDADGDDINYNTLIKDYKETQRMTNINIPLMFQYQTGLGNGPHKFYAGLGFKLGIPIYGKYSMSNDSLIASGLYHAISPSTPSNPDTKNEFYDQRDLGYGVFTGNSQKDDIAFKLACMGLVETGVKWHLNDVLSLYTGLYFEYGFNDIVKKHNDEFVVYNRVTPENPQFNSVLTSQYTNNDKTESFADRVVPMAIGLKVRLGVDLCGGKEKPAPAPKPTPKPTPVPEIKQELPPPPPPVKPAVEPESKKARARDILAARGAEEEEKPLVLPVSKDHEIAESKYGKIKKAITLEDLVYEKGSAKLLKSEEAKLDAAIAEIKAEYGNEQVNIICVGHTCDLGSLALNMKLAQDRANGVRDYLKKNGGFTNVEAVSEGPNSPRVPNDSDYNRTKNRRVVLIVR